MAMDVLVPEMVFVLASISVASTAVPRKPMHSSRCTHQETATWHGLHVALQFWKRHTPSQPLRRQIALRHYQGISPGRDACGPLAGELEVVVGTGHRSSRR